jgi:hypothetical protein
MIDSNFEEGFLSYREVPGSGIRVKAMMLNVEPSPAESRLPAPFDENIMM